MPRDPRGAARRALSDRRSATDAWLRPSGELRDHTVGPIWHGGESCEPALLASAYRNCLELAAENQIRSIAFPAISCGVYGYPIDQAASIAVREILAFVEAHSCPVEVILVAFDEATAEILRDRSARAQQGDL